MRATPVGGRAAVWIYVQPGVPDSPGAPRDDSILAKPSQPQAAAGGSTMPRWPCSPATRIGSHNHAQTRARMAVSL